MTTDRVLYQTIEALFDRYDANAALADANSYERGALDAIVAVLKIHADAMAPTATPAMMIDPDIIRYETNPTPWEWWRGTVFLVVGMVVGGFIGWMA